MFHRADRSTLCLAAIGMTSLVLIALSGAAGSVLRYLTSVLAIELLGAAVT
jgi:hypothetical protein